MSVHLTYSSRPGMLWRARRTIAAFLVAFLVALAAAVAMAAGSAHASGGVASAYVGSEGSHASAPLSVRVSGNQLIDQNGTKIRFIGFSRDESQWTCTAPGGNQYWDGPASVETQTGVTAMLAWNINAVRIPLNEDCWLGINGLPTVGTAARYKSAIVNYVNLLNANGIYAIVELHLSAPGTYASKQQQDMPDQDHSPAFWSSVASTFSNNRAVVFDIYNEPMGVYSGIPRGTSIGSIWSCWLNGCSVNTVFLPPAQTPVTHTWQTAGMQELVNVIRVAGARNPIMLGGIRYANDLSQWQAYLPVDSANQLVASVHEYSWNYCSTSSCWTSTLGVIAASHPVVIGEFGEPDCSDGFANTLMNFADSYGMSYVAWSWDVRSGGNQCNALNDAGASFTLITDYNGTPGYFGAGVKQHFLVATKILG